MSILFVGTQDRTPMHHLVKESLGTRTVQLLRKTSRDRAPRVDERRAENIIGHSTCQIAYKSTTV